MSEEKSVIFNTLSQFKNKRDELYTKIKRIINAYVIEDEFEYKYMENYGLTPRQRLYFYEEIKNSLIEFTQNKCDDWCSTTSSYLISGIDGFLNALVNIKKIDEFDAEELAQIIYDTITYQLGDDEHCPDLLEEVVEILDSEDAEDAEDAENDEDADAEDDEDAEDTEDAKDAKDAEDDKKEQSENKINFIKCSYYNCDTSFVEEYFSSGLLSHPINEEDKYHQILEGLLKTRIFCIKCSKNHATIICLNSKMKIG